MVMRVNGAAIRAMRQDRGIPLRQLALSAGVSAPYLSRIERDLRGTTGVSDEAVRAIAAALALPLEAILSANQADAA